MGEKTLAELSATSGEITSLVRDSGREKTLKKLESFFEKNKQDVEKKNCEKRDRLWAEYFAWFSQKFFRVRPSQIKEFDDEELKQIDEFIAKKARVQYNKTLIFFLVPIVGWFGYLIAYYIENCYVCGDILRSWHYMREREKNKMILGKDYFPAHAVREYLKEYRQ